MNNISQQEIIALFEYLDNEDPPPLNYIILPDARVNLIKEETLPGIEEEKPLLKLPLAD